MTPERWARIEALYHAAYPQSPTDRAAFLAAACLEDADLRREVEALLDQPASAEDFFATRAIRMPALAGSGLSFEALTGRVLGAYELRALIGAGGMGDVYRAHDTKLGRDVAVKVLPREFTSDPARLARFEREARMLAALNHPHVCAIYGFEEHAAVRFLVLELVEGQTLAERLGDGSGRAPLPVMAALEIARQVAAGLEVAHDRGVIHRDLKPSNVKFTPADVVKVLDFGLAKSIGGDASAAGAHQEESREGAVLGTAPYMSPEQARGLTVDERTDIWSFGVVLFEMVAGQRPFDGVTTADTLASILTREPDWRQLPASATPALRRLLRRCLQKDPQRRLQSIADARVQIEDLLRGAGDEPVAPERSTRLAWTIATVTTLGATALAIWLLTRPDAPAFPFSVLPPAGVTLAAEERPVISPDGQRLAFIAYDAEGTPRLYVDVIGDAPRATALANTEGASLPFWSPASDAIGFFAQGSLQTINIFTGGPRTLAPAGGPRGGTWSHFGVIVYVPSPRDGPYRIAASGEGKAERIPAPAAASPGAWFPSFLPDGLHFIEFEPTVNQPENAAIWVVSLDTGRRERLVESHSNALYASGHLLFWRDGTLWGQTFDHRTRRVSGRPVRVADGVAMNPVTNQALFSVSNTGMLAYFAGAVSQTELVWLDRGGNELGRPGASGVISTLALAPDDTSVVFDRMDPLRGTFDLWRLVFSDASTHKLTFHPSQDVFPLFSVDGARVFFMSARERPPQIYGMVLDAAGSESRVAATKLPSVPSGWSDGGRTLFMTVTDPATATGDVASMSFDTGEPRRVVATPNDERYGTPSPNGRWLAYVSNVSGTYEVHVQGPEGTFRRQVSAGGGSQPQWPRDGRELIYLARNRQLMSVTFDEQGATFTTAPPRRLFATRTLLLEVQGTARTYAVASDGQRFLVANATDESRSASISMVMNWRSQLGK